MSGLYHGHLLEFPYIRVDCFTSPPIRGKWMLPMPKGIPGPPRVAPAAQLYLLTHVHSDHLIGLCDNFTGIIICSPDTKRLLLRLEYERDRAHLYHGNKERRKLKFEGFLTNGGADRIVTLNPGESRIFDYCVEKVCITLLDANHCPGSSMFLIASERHAVLHTGDLRAGKHFLERLRSTPCLQDFIVPTHSRLDSLCQPLKPQRQLDRIYLDTSAILGTGDMPDKKPVLDALVTQMGLYPPATVFFLNTWCLGWEDVIKEVARSFKTAVHVDRYKRALFAAVHSDPSLLASTTEDHTATRFHACDRFFRCAACKFQQGVEANMLQPRKLVVQVDMVEVKSAAWDLQYQQFLGLLNKAALGEGQWPTTILAPLARHSPLPELQELVKLFRPASLSPNTLVPGNNGAEYLLFPKFFQDGLDNEALSTVSSERDMFLRFGLPRHQATLNAPVKTHHLLLDRDDNGDGNIAGMTKWHFTRVLDDSRASWRNDQLYRLSEHPSGKLCPQESSHLVNATPRQTTGDVTNRPLNVGTTAFEPLRQSSACNILDFRHLSITSPKRRKRKPSAFQVDITHLRRLAQGP